MGTDDDQNQIEEDQWALDSDKVLVWCPTNKFRNSHGTLNLNGELRKVGTEE